MVYFKNNIHAGVGNNQFTCRRLAGGGTDTAPEAFDIGPQGAAGSDFRIGAVVPVGTPWRACITGKNDSLSSLLVQPDKFFGRAAILLPEYPVKITEVMDAAFLADLNDLQAGFQKQPRRIIHPFYVDEFSGRHVQEPAEGSVQVFLGKAGEG